MLKRLLLTAAFILSAQSMRAQAPPKDVSFCELANHPKLYDGKMIRVRGTASVYFEDFSLFSNGCKTDQYIWLAFGGDVPGLVPSTVNDTYRTPGADIKVKGVAYGIKKDENFRRFYALIADRHGNKPAYQVTATLTGAFFAGEESKLPNGRITYRGYGHLGCCSLLVITQVSDVKSVPPADLNLRGTVLMPGGKPAPGLGVINEVVGGTPAQIQQVRTDSDGHFAFANAGQVLRIEDQRYRPLAIRVEPGKAPIRVQLEEASRSDWVVLRCGPATDSAARIGTSVLFSLPPQMTSSISNDDGLRGYFVFARGQDSSNADLYISVSEHETLNTMSGGRTLDSEDYRRRWIKNASGLVIGIEEQDREGPKNSYYGRVATFFGSGSAAYEVRSRTRAHFLDKIVNSACLAK